MKIRVLVLFVCAAGVFGVCGASANSAQNDASVGPTGAIAVVGDMRPNLRPRVFTFDAAKGARHLSPPGRDQRDSHTDRGAEGESACGALGRQRPA